MGDIGINRLEAEALRLHTELVKEYSKKPDQEKVDIHVQMIRDLGGIEEIIGLFRLFFTESLEFDAERIYKGLTNPEKVSVFDVSQEIAQSPDTPEEHRKKLMEFYIPNGVDLMFYDLWTPFREIVTNLTFEGHRAWETNSDVRLGVTVEGIDLDVIYKFTPVEVARIRRDENNRLQITGNTRIPASIMEPLTKSDFESYGSTAAVMLELYDNCVNMSPETREGIYNNTPQGQIDAATEAIRNRQE